MKKYIYLFSSDIPVFVGQMKWNVITSFERLFRKVDTEMYETLLLNLEKERREKCKDERVIQKELLDLDIQLQDRLVTKKQYSIKVKRIEEKKNEIMISLERTKNEIDKLVLTEDELMKKVLGEEISRIVDKDVSPVTKQNESKKLVDELVLDTQTKTDLKKQVKSFVNKKHGVKEEETMIDKYENLHDLELDKSQVFYKKDFFEIETDKCMYVFKVGGKMDGVDTLNKRVIEIKNRTQRLFYQLREYEKTQVTLYMYLAGYSRAVLVECYRDKTNEIEVSYNERYLDWIKSKLKCFCKGFINFIESSDEIKMEYLRSSDKSKENFIWDIIDGVNVTLELSERSELSELGGTESVTEGSGELLLLDEDLV